MNSSALASAAQALPVDLAESSVDSGAEFHRIIAKHAQSTPDKTAVSDEEGRFTIRGLAEGAYAIDADHEDWASSESREAKS